MISIQGVYHNGKIELKRSANQKIPDTSKVLITFLTDIEDAKSQSIENEEPEVQDVEEEDEAYYQSIRKYERVKAEGNITIIDGPSKFRFRLNDYSQGGLSFISDWKYDIGKILCAGIVDPNDQESILMELEMEVRGVFSEDGDGFKIGCMFVDPVDEDLWHGLAPYLN